MPELSIHAQHQFFGSLNGLRSYLSCQSKSSVTATRIKKVKRQNVNGECGRKCKRHPQAALVDKTISAFCGTDISFYLSFIYCLSSHYLFPDTECSVIDRQGQGHGSICRVLTCHSQSPGFSPYYCITWVQWYTSVIPAVQEERRWEDQGFKVILSYIMSLRPTWAT